MMKKSITIRQNCQRVSLMHSPGYFSASMCAPLQPLKGRLLSNGPLFSGGNQFNGVFIKAQTLSLLCEKTFIRGKSRGFPSGFMCVCLWHFCNVGRLGLTERRNINYRTENLIRMYKPCDNYLWNPLSACISGQETEGSRCYRGDSWDF